MSKNYLTQRFVRCECGKRGWVEKAGAKAVRRRTPDGRHLSVYRCRLGTNLWHLGHLPMVVVHGDATRDDIYVPRVRTSA